MAALEGATSLRCRFTARIIVLGVCASVLAGCAGPRLMMPAPVLYSKGIAKAFAERLAPTLKSGVVDVLYVTDRTPTKTETGRLDYGIGRSPSVAYGKVEVSIGQGAEWSSLQADATATVRDKPLGLGIASVEEFDRTPPSPYPYRLVDGRPELEPSVAADLERARARFRDEILKRLSRTDRKEVFLYIHGVANSFSEAAFTTAELWHFFGREGVPVAYTWPAGGKGLLRGYTYDRESSEFTINHLKSFLKALTSIEEVEGVHIISHSRGTDVATTAVRELLIETRARGEDPLERYRIRNLVLAAPDLNVEIMLARTAVERIGAAVGRLTIYTSKGDKAIGIAETLFGGGTRLGQADETLGLPEHMLATTSQMHDRVAVIEYTGSNTGEFGHTYFRANPAVASDLVLTVRYGRSPGAEHGRPLKSKGSIFWEIDDSYLTDRGS